MQNSSRKSAGRKGAKKNNTQKPVFGPQTQKQAQRSARRQAKRQGPRNNPGPLTGRQQAVAAAYATGQAGKGATVAATRDSCRVQHREFIGNVSGSVAFAIASSFALNPGLAASFPWLSNMAQNWETYRFRKLRLCYYTRTGSNVPGSVILAHDPDSSDGAPATEQIMTTYERCREDAPWKDIVLDLLRSSLREGQARKFIRSGALAANEDIKLYDSGNLYIGTVDGTAVNWGKLWLEYDVDFQTPQLPPAGGGGALTSGTYTNVAGTGVATATVFGTGGVILGNTILSVAANIASLQNLVVGAEYQITYGRTDTAAAAATIVSATGLTAVTNPLGPCPASNSVKGAVTSTWLATATIGTVTVACTFAGTPSNISLIVAQIPVMAL